MRRRRMLGGWTAPEGLFRWPSPHCSFCRGSAPRAPIHSGLPPPPHTHTVRTPTTRCQCMDSGPVTYVIVTVSGPRQWEVRQRFSAFSALHDSLVSAKVDTVFTSRAVLPAKTLFFNKSDKVIHTRRAIFELYLQGAVQRPAVMCSPLFLEFLGACAACPRGRPPQGRAECTRCACFRVSV
jgi:hypothetical protein